MSTPTTVQWLRRAVDRIGRGSGRRATQIATAAVRTARRVWDGGTGWLGEATGVISWALRAAALLGAALIARTIITAVATGLYERIAHGGAPWLLWGAALAWTVAAYRAGADGWTPGKTAAADAPDTPIEGHEQPGAEEPPPTPSKPWRPSTVELVAAVRDIGTPHAQLKPLAEHLRVTTDTVRAVAAEMGWRVKDVRMVGRSASAGLRWDEMPSPPPLGPSPSVVGAGQAADDNDDDTSEGEPREGLRVRRTETATYIYDPADAHQHHKI
ncbi:MULTISPECIES: hypothetical protein [unclassified Streptomyces]|uniref:hypothetical protein n=1 Tax=unclassified Streptomyces TaxID=2593676 RepID=UPI000DDBD970|nr:MULTISPECIES: hypothetical protein [unclassified Streptomyces]QZZ26543.1 hypothetical protein A7X85_09995 [Streptomyces sp. ST1015]